MAVQFKCPKCGQPLETRDEAVGKAGQCPQCKETITVPEPSTSPPSN